MFVVATLQLPGLVVMIVPILWSFSHLSGIARIVFIIGCFAIAIIDTPLKAMLLGRGLPVPTFVILVGAIGGMISMGMMGLFVGAVILCLGYRLLVSWVGGEDAAVAEGAEAGAAPA
jgi:predicted PurR-regulated permease PerM